MTAPPGPSLSWSHPTALAPLEGVGHAAFRALAVEAGGVGVAFTEFVSVGAAPARPASLAAAVVKPPGVPLVVQLLGSDPERMARAAEVVVASGADGVDVNLGCPAKRVVGRGAGAGLLTDPKRIRLLLRRLREVVPVPLSAKMRAGLDTTDHALSVAEACVLAGVDYLTIHPRRRADFYAGVADWRIVRELAARLPVPVVGNGDCWYAADALRLQAESGCAAVMLGRPAIRNPWIFAQLADLRAGRPPCRPDGPAVVAHLARAVARYRAQFEGSPRLVLGKVKELVRYLGRAVPDDGAFAREALRQPTPEALLAVAERHLAGRPAEALDLDADGARRLERTPRL